MKYCIEYNNTDRKQVYIRKPNYDMGIGFEICVCISNADRFTLMQAYTIISLAKEDAYYLDNQESYKIVVLE